MLSKIQLIRAMIDKMKARNKGDTEGEDKSKWKILLYSCLIIVTDIISTSIKVLCSLFSMVGLLVMLASITVIILASSFFIKPGTEGEDGWKDPTIGGSNQVQLSGLQWTEEELAQYGASLSEYERNLYRLGVAIKQVQTNYGEKTFDFNNDKISHYFALGADSIETSLDFYRNTEQKDILKHPIKIGGNSLGYGYLGLHHTETLDALTGKGGYLTISKNVNSAVKQKYPPQSSVSNQNDYTPFATVSLMAKFNDKYRGIVLTKDGGDSAGRNASQKIDDIMAQWGIQNNKEDVKAFLELIVTQAQFHGGHKREHEGYIHFACAFYVATSDNDAERSFDKWKLVGKGYSESSARESMLGMTGEFRGLEKYGSPSEFPQKVGSIEWELNGQKIGKPLWTYLWEKFKDTVGMQEAWRVCKSVASSSGNVQDRVLNFHYGINSFYMAKKIESELISKMGVPQTEQGNNGGSTEGGFPSGGSGNYQMTPGKSQMSWEGKSTDEHLANYSGSAKSYILSSLKPHFGKTNGLDLGKETDKMYGVPFYAQSVEPREEYGTTLWYPGTATYNRSGCMVYSFSYALSAMTGKLVNPPETGAILIMNGGLGGSGAVMSKWVSIFNKMGLNADATYSSANHVYHGTKYFGKIDETLGKGGVVIVREGGRPYASGSNHYIVITGKHGDKYSIWTSTSQAQSKSLHTAQELGAKMHRELIYVWK